MSNAFRTLVLAAAVAGLSPVAAQASILFSPVGSFTLKDDGTIKDGDSISQLITGVTISGAEIFLKNGDAALTYAIGGSDRITITFDKSIVHVNGMTMKRFSDSQIDVAIDGKPAQGFGKTTAPWTDTTLARECPATEPSCDRALLTDAPDQFISSVTFSAGGLIGLNDLQFLIASTGGSVPEPAGFGLAALALVAAGAASRRRSAR